MVQDEDRLSLDKIARDYDIVLVDSAIRDFSDNIAQQIYDCHEELAIDTDDLQRKIRYTSEVTNLIHTNENIWTIQEVVDEFKDYSDILNGQVAYHQRNIKSKKSRKKSRKRIRVTERRKGRKSKRRKSEYNNEDFEVEEEALKILSIYANQIFNLYSALADRIIEFDDSLLEAVLARAEEVKKDSRLTPKNKPKKPRYTKEKLVIAAYESAKGKEVAVISSSYFSKRLFNSCFAKDGPFEVPSEGCIHLYSDHNRDNRYTIEFNTIRLP
ncbi:hypothetical protein KY343_00560 [Candidatus Woesearchaeota archaeon]|nr:hypothetical protein [Candidatus Woesearchaeota archaeon]